MRRGHDRVVLGFGHDNTADRERHGVIHDCAGLRLPDGQLVFARPRHAAELDRGRALHPLHPVAVGGSEDDDVAALVGHNGRVGRDAGDLHGDLRDLGERAAHAVGVDDG